jgi:hypothetical protein
MGKTKNLMIYQVILGWFEFIVWGQFKKSEGAVT